MAETKAIAIAVLAIMLGVVIAYSPMYAFQNQLAPQATGQGADFEQEKNAVDNAFIAIFNAQAANETYAAQDGARSMAVGFASSSGGMVLAAGIGLAAAVTCYFIIKRKVVDQKMLKAHA